MGDDFTKTELRQMMAIMNSAGINCKLCSGIRKKLEIRIKEMPEDEPEFFKMEEG
jgi:hypothetical protein